VFSKSTIPNHNDAVPEIDVADIQSAHFTATNPGLKNQPERDVEGRLRKRDDLFGLFNAEMWLLC